MMKKSLMLSSNRSDRKKVLFVMNTMGRAGAERALIELTKAIDTKDADIYLYVIIPRGELFDELPEKVRILNKSYDNRSVLSRGGSLFILRELVRYVFKPRCFTRLVRRMCAVLFGRSDVSRRVRLEKTIRRLFADGAPGMDMEFDLATAYLEGPATWYVAEKVKAKKKAAFLHIDYRKAGYDRTMDNGCYEAFDRIFAVSENVKEGFLSVYPEYESKTELFMNIINTDRINALAAQEGFTDGFDGVRLLTVGRLHYQKGYDIAVETARLLKDAGRRFKWCVIGEGAEEKKLRALIKEKGVEDEFVLMGAKSNPYPYFKQSDIYVCTSRFEGKSIVIEEAQTLGLPIISAQTTGIREQVNDGEDGIIVPGEPDKLARAISRLIDDEELRQRLGHAARLKMQTSVDEAKRFVQLMET